jgi:hypothetical protein
VSAARRVEDPRRVGFMIEQLFVRVILPVADPSARNIVTGGA